MRPGPCWPRGGAPDPQEAPVKVGLTVSHCGYSSLADCKPICLRRNVNVSQYSIRHKWGLCAGNSTTRICSPSLPHERIPSRPELEDVSAWVRPDRDSADTGGNARRDVGPALATHARSARCRTARARGLGVYPGCVTIPGGTCTKFLRALVSPGPAELVWL